MPTARTARQGIQSVEVAGPILRSLAAHDGPMMLKDLALAARMPAAKAHRYLVSLTRLKLVTQRSDDGRYDLGPFALELGLSALGRLDAARPATAAMEQLRDTLKETAALLAWGTHGATFIRIAEPLRAVTVSLRAGSTAPLTRSASGLVFAAWLPPAQTRAMIATELKENVGSRAKGPPRTQAAMNERLVQVRADGIASAVSAFAPGMNSYAAPIFDHTGRIIFTLALIGHAVDLGEGPKTRAARALKEIATDVSTQLGYR